MNVLFVYSLQNTPSLLKPLWSPEQIQFGISYISAILKKYGHLTKLAVLSSSHGKKNYLVIDKAIANFKPKLVCFTAVSSEYEFIRDIADYLKLQYPDIYTLIGGVHVTLNIDEVKQDNFDAFCIGEGEYPVLELVAQLEKNEKPERIGNLLIKNGLIIEKNEARPFLSDLDDLPFPDREMWHEWTKEDLGVKHSVLLGRGCSFNCTYCSNHALRKIAPGNYLRLRDPKKIVEEINEVARKYPEQSEIYLEVETFSTNRKWAIELCKELEGLNKILPKPLSYGVNIRVMPGVDFSDLFEACKKSNFRFINIGLESGSERVRKLILKRKYSNNDFINVVNTARKYGLQVALYNMIGIPGETKADFEETIKLNRICLPDWHMTGIFFPYPGTSIYQTAKELGLLDKKIEVDSERSKAILDSPEFTKKQIQRGYELFDYYVYKGYRPLYKIIVQVLMKKIRAHCHLMNFYRKLTSEAAILKKMKYMMKRI
jgi:radical SAM superfamily enzyme YgiQ (UPF0313 family)